MYFKQSVSRSLLPAVPPETSRRALLKGSAAGGLVLGLTLVSGRGFAANEGSPGGGKAVTLASTGAPPEPNAFVRIAADDTVTVIVKHLDMGQGNTTGPADDRRRGARRRLVADAFRVRAGRCQALRQPRLRHPGHRRLDRRQQQLGPTAQGRRRRPRHAGAGRRRRLEGAGRRDRGEEGRSDPQVRQARHLRRAGRGRRQGARADRRHAEGPQGLHADRHEDPPHRLYRERPTVRPNTRSTCAARTC